MALMRGLVLIGVTFCVSLASSRVVGAETGDGLEGMYPQRCATCHVQQGVLEPGQRAIPGLLEIARTRSAVAMVQAVLHGQPVANGMPSHADLANEDIAAIVNHLRQAAGITDNPVDVVDVARIRSESRPVAPLSDDQQRRAEQLYVTHCAACHAVDRSGRSGPSLYQWAMQQLGTDQVQTTLHFGSSWGMPAWGMNQALSAGDINLLARYLQTQQQQPLGDLPGFGLAAVRRSWQQIPSREDSEASDAGGIAGDLFVALLHDTGQVMIFAANSARVMAVVDAVTAPHHVVRSADGRYLYVMSRGADVVAVDLSVTPPEVTASVKVGYEGRSLAVSPGTGGMSPTVAVGSYWPPQVVVLDGHTLEPLALHKLSASGLDNASGADTADGAVATEVTQVLAVPPAGNYLAVGKHAGDLIRFNQQGIQRTRSTGRAFLRAGSWDTSGRYFLLPTDDGQVVVLDNEADQGLTILDVPHLLGGNQGVAWQGKPTSPLWFAAGLGSSGITRVSTTGPPADWRVEHLPAADATGSLTITAHDLSPHVWFDRPLHPSSELSGTIGVIRDAAGPAPEVVALPVRQWAGLADSGARVLHPQFNRRGDEVWLTVWNRQDETSAIVVVDADSLQLQQVITDPRLVTPIRTYHLPE
ncbi:MAG: cytochrome D1 domain-containing protein [Pseudomonadota bacterium]